MYGPINEAMRRHVTDSAGGSTSARIADRASSVREHAEGHGTVDVRLGG